MAQVLLGILAVAFVAVVSLPQARMASAGLGWVPFWLLALPASAWCALWLTGQRAHDQPAPSLVAKPRRHSIPIRRRSIGNVRTPRRAHAA